VLWQKLPFFAETAPCPFEILAETLFDPSLLHAMHQIRISGVHDPASRVNKNQGQFFLWHQRL
jgi:hypothetical protein